MRTTRRLSRALTRKARFFVNTRLQLDLLAGWFLGFGGKDGRERPPHPTGDEAIPVLIWRAVRQWVFDLRNDNRAYYAHVMELTGIYRARLESIGQPRMPDREVADMVHYSTISDYATRVGPRDTNIDESIFELPDEELYFKQKGARFLCEMIDRYRGDIATVLNIGARIDPVLFFAARRYPEIKFMSLDFQTNLQKQNEAVFKARGMPRNWRFVSGYALDMVKAGLRADMVFFMATSVLFTKAEFRGYMDALENQAKYLVFSESWFPRLKSLGVGSLVMPEDLDPERPENAGSMNTQRNYLHELNRAGFDVLRSHLMNDHRDGTYFVLNIAARNRKLATNVGSVSG